MLQDLRRILAALAKDLKALLDPDPQAFLALRTALAGVTAILLACALDLDNPWWAGISVFGVTQSRPRATVRRAFDRAVGTLGGASVGFFAAAFLYDHALLELLLVAGAAFCVYGYGRSEHGYAVLLGGVTMVLVLFGSLVNPEESLTIAVFRAMEVLLGIAVTLFFELTFASEEPPGAAAATSKPGIWSKPLDLELLSAALTGGIAIAAIPVVWNWLVLPGMSQTPITAFVILTALHDNPVFKALNRMIGCLLGGLFGLLAARLAGDAFLPWILLLFVGLYVAAHIKNGPADSSYSGHQASIALMVAMVQGLAPSPDILPAINRLTGIFGGILVVVVFQVTVMPLIRHSLLWIDGRAPAPRRG